MHSAVIKNPLLDKGATYVYMNYPTMTGTVQGAEPMFHFSERDFAYVILSELKRMAGEYATACLESTREDIRRMFELKLQNTLNKQAYLYQMMGQFQFTEPADYVNKQQVMNEVQRQSDAGFRLQNYMHDRLHSGSMNAEQQRYAAEQQPMFGTMPQYTQASYEGYGQMQGMPQAYASSLNTYGMQPSYGGYTMPGESQYAAPSYSQVNQQERGGSTQNVNSYMSGSSPQEQSRGSAAAQNRSSAAGTNTEQGDYSMQTGNRQTGKLVGTDPNLNLNPNASQDQTQNQARTSGYAAGSAANETAGRSQNQEQQQAASQQALNNTYRSGPAEASSDSAAQTGAALNQSVGASDADYHVGTNAQMNAGGGSESDDPMDKYFS